MKSKKGAVYNNFPVGYVYVKGGRKVDTIVIRSTGKREKKTDSLPYAKHRSRLFLFVLKPPTPQRDTYGRMDGWKVSSVWRVSLPLSKDVAGCSTGGDVRRKGAVLLVDTT